MRVSRQRCLSFANRDRTTAQKCLAALLLVTAAGPFAWGQSARPVADDSPKALRSSTDTAVDAEGATQPPGAALQPTPQQQLAQQTALLLTLATELKAEVDRSRVDMLSVEVVRTANTIEKLAKVVKDKVKYVEGAK